MDDRKLVVVTAGSRGIGAAIVRQLVGSGYRVVFTYKQNSELARDIALSLNRHEEVCHFYPCDVGNVSEVEVFCEKLLEKHGVPYGIINNAGITKDNLHFSMEIDDWLAVINTNLNSLFYINYYLLNAMIMERDGCIININSVSGLRGNAGQSNYAASKSGQYGLTKSLAREVGNFNIRVNCISPGPVATDMLSTLPEKSLNQLIRLTPLRKLGMPEDIALMTDFLLGPGGKHITGQNIVIDGGLSV